MRCCVYKSVNVRTLACCNYGSLNLPLVGVVFFLCKLMDELFKAYFQDGKCLSDHSVLRECAEKIHLEGADAVLANPQAYLEVVEAQIQQYARGVSGVPHFLISSDKAGRPVQLSGAQPSDLLSEIFDDLK